MSAQLGDARPWLPPSRDQLARDLSALGELADDAATAHGVALQRLALQVQHLAADASKVAGRIDADLRGCVQ